MKKQLFNDEIFYECIGRAVDFLGDGETDFADEMYVGAPPPQDTSPGQRQDEEWDGIYYDHNNDEASAEGDTSPQRGKLPGQSHGGTSQGQDDCVTSPKQDDGVTWPKQDAGVTSPKKDDGDMSLGQEDGITLTGQDEAALERWVINNWLPHLDRQCKGLTNKITLFDGQAEKWKWLNDSVGLLRSTNGIDP
jgi:hypothetical protein